MTRFARSASRLLPLLAALAIAWPGAARPVRADYWVFVGTYTGGESRGIYTFRLDEATGALQPGEVTEGIENPSFLALHPNGQWLYAVSEVNQTDGEPGGQVAAFRIDPATGGLTPLNSQSSGGAAPCQLVVDATGHFVLVANYGGGSVAALGIQQDGSLTPIACQIQHEGSSVNPQRQEAPHAHSMTLTPDNRFAVAADLGTDSLIVYQFDARSGELVPHQTVQLEPGSGPRHFTFHPSLPVAYAICELGSTITRLDYDPQRGQLTPRQTLSTLPSDYAQSNSTADLHVGPGGRWLFGSNRGHDSLAVFRIAAADGTLEPAGFVSTRGKTPRNFNIEPEGRWLLAANQDSDTIAVFRLSSDEGLADVPVHTASCPRPVCIQFLKIEAPAP